MPKGIIGIPEQLRGLKRRLRTASQPPPAVESARELAKTK